MEENKIKQISQCTIPKCTPTSSETSKISVATFALL